MPRAKPKVYLTDTGERVKRNYRNFWSPEKVSVFIISGGNGQYFNPDKGGWHHRPKLYKSMVDAKKAVGRHAMGEVSILEYALSLKFSYQAKSVPGKKYGSHRGVLI